MEEKQLLDACIVLLLYMCAAAAAAVAALDPLFCDEKKAAAHR
jgi:hypothetical protein